MASLTLCGGFFSAFISHIDYLFACDMAASAKGNRGWEKKTTAGSNPAGQSPLQQVTSFVDGIERHFSTLRREIVTCNTIVLGLTEVERASHRAAYLHLLASMTVRLNT
jgi:hypothetical protein